MPCLERREGAAPDPSTQGNDYPLGGEVPGLAPTKASSDLSLDRARGSSPRPRAKKSLAQHFLVDGRFARRVLRAAELSPNDLVVEVGPGRGSLTRELAAAAGRVVAVEIDEELLIALQEKLGDRPNLRIVRADAREVPLESLVPSCTPYKVVANLPYYAASPIVRRFLEATHKPRLMVFMVQREVARNMAASPGAMSVLSVMVQLYGKPRIVSYVPPKAFRPAPKVTSAIVRIDVYPEPALVLESTGEFMRLVKAGFSSRRKQIHNSLRQGLSASPQAVEEMLLRAGIDPKRRAQTLSIPEWGGLYDAFREMP